MPLDFANNIGNFPRGGAPQFGGANPLMAPYAQSPFQFPPQTPFSEPLPEPEQVEPPQPSEEFREKAQEYIGDWLKQSAEFIRQKLDKWKLIEDLYNSDRPLSTWDISLGDLAYERDKALSSWKTNLVIGATKTIVDNFTHKCSRTIFFSDDYFECKPYPKPGSRSVEDTHFTTARKFTEILKDDFDHAQLESQLSVGLRYLAMWGHVVFKAGWFERKVPVYYRDMFGRLIKWTDKVYQCPDIAPIKPHRLCPDWRATNMNIQSWRGIGHRVDIDYYTVIERYNRGTYHLNKEEFKRRWNEKDEANYTSEIELMEDPDRQDSGDIKTTGIMAWEWHGRMPWQDEWIEVVATFLTERTAQDPLSGLLVRLRRGAALKCGLRPFVGAHFQPVGTPFGVGAVEPHLPLIRHLSNLLAILTDNAKQSVQGMWQVRMGSPAKRALEESDNGDIAEAGRWWPVSRLDYDIKRLEHSSIDAGSLVTAFKFGYNNLEREAWTSDTNLGLGQQRKTALEASVIQAEGLTPIQNITRQLAKTLLNPLGTLCLAMWQEFEQDSRQIIVEDLNNEPQLIEITQEEIRTGVYKVKFILDQQDEMRIAKYNALTQGAQLAREFEPQMIMKGYDINWPQFFYRGLELLGLDKAGEFIHKLTPEEQQQRLMMMQLQQGPGGGGGPPMPGGGPPMAQAGGPAGPEPTDENIRLQEIQEMMRGEAQPTPLD